MEQQKDTSKYITIHGAEKSLEIPRDMLYKIEVLKRNNPIYIYAILVVMLLLLIPVAPSLNSFGRSSGGSNIEVYGIAFLVIAVVLLVLHFTQYYYNTYWHLHYSNTPEYLRLSKSKLAEYAEVIDELNREILSRAPAMYGHHQEYPPGYVPQYGYPQQPGQAYPPQPGQGFPPQQQQQQQQQQYIPPQQQHAQGQDGYPPQPPAQQPVSNPYQQQYTNQGPEIPQVPDLPQMPDSQQPPNLDGTMPPESEQLPPLS